MTTDSLVTLVEQMQARYQLFPKYNATAAETPVVVVAVSGGADSVCLLALLQQVAAAWRLTLHVAHLDHALRPDSAADAEFVATLAATYGVPFHIKRVQPGELAAHEGGIEAAARRTRYEFLAQVALTVTPATQTPTVALAHHADDQAETVLHHLVRGSGLQGLGGMRPVATYLTEGTPLDLRLVRPLLYARRAAIQQYLQEHELSWREDSTNVDQRYTRNYLRHTVLPALTTVNPHAVESIGRAAQLAAEEHDRLVAYDAQLLRSLQWSPPSDEQVAAIVANSTNAPPGGRRSELVLNLAALTAYPHATQRALLRLAHTWVAPVPTELSLARLDQLCATIAQAGSGGPHPFIGEVAWSVAGALGDRPALLSLHHRDTLPFAAAQPLLANGIVLPLPAVAPGTTHTILLASGWQVNVSALQRASLPADWRDRNQPWRAFFDCAQLAQPHLSTPSPGQDFAPLGLNGHRKQIGDLFTDHKVPSELRSHWPLLVDGSTHEVHWVCGIQPGHLARVTPATEIVLCVTFYRCQNQETSEP